MDDSTVIVVLVIVGLGLFGLSLIAPLVGYLYIGFLVGKTELTHRRGEKEERE